MITLLFYPEMIQSIFVGSSISSIARTCLFIQWPHLLTESEHSNPIDGPSLTAEEWLSVLALSTKYDMEIIRQSAIQKLLAVSPRLDPIQQIVAARQYNCAALVTEPIRNLIARTQRLTLEEVQTLPSVDLHTIIERREIRANQTLCKRCSSTWTYPSSTWTNPSST